jgi:type I restriction enzyme S subunit
MRFGLPEDIITKLNEVFEVNAKVDKALIFGSRAKGNYRSDSDIDIAIKGADITLDDILKMQVEFEEKGIKYKIDLVDYHTVKEEALIEHVDRVGIEMYRRLKVYKLGELAKKITSGGTPSTKNAEYYDGNIPWLNTKEINFNRIWRTEKYISEKGLKNSSAKWIEENSIIVAMYGATAAKVAINKIPLTTNQACCNLTIDQKKADYEFVFYYIWSKYEELENIAVGAAQQNLSVGVIADFPIQLPPLSEQTAIAEVLSSLDNKIDLLHRQNKTLEQLAETLFRQWFVEEAEESWEVGTIEDVVLVKGGTTPSTSNPDFWDGEIYWTSPRDLANNASIFLFNTERKITEEGLAQIGSGLLPIGTVLLSSRAPIGYLAITQIPVAINQGYIAIICDKSISNYFMFLWCKANMETIENAGNGSVFQEISKSSFKTLEFVKPPKDKLLKFDRTVEPIFQKIMSNQIQIRALTQLRDALLPKLMSGEIRIDLEDSRLTKPVKTKKANVGQ